MTASFTRTLHLKVKPNAHAWLDKVSQAQRRGHRRQAKRWHRRAANLRNEALHQFSRKLVNRYQRIIVGDVSSQKLVRTRMAKAVLDSGWGQLKTQLQYKGQWAGRDVQIVSERNTTRECSSCGRPTGSKRARCKGMDLRGL